MIHTLFMWICPLVVGVTLIVRATTHFILYSDRLVIRRIGLVWMEILFRDVEEIEYERVFLNQFSQIRMYRLGTPGLPGRKFLRIKKRSGIRYVLLNPGDPERVIRAWRNHGAQFPSEQLFETGRSPLPDFLKSVR
jgi:hypothetical protein